jgi:hypothetical protein
MVYLDDDNIQQAIGIGNVLIKLNFGLKIEVWHILHVPGLLKILISMGK